MRKIKEMVADMYFRLKAAESANLTLLDENKRLKRSESALRTNLQAEQSRNAMLQSQVDEKGTTIHAAELERTKAAILRALSIWEEAGEQMTFTGVLEQMYGIQ